MIGRSGSRNQGKMTEITMSDVMTSIPFCSSTSARIGSFVSTRSGTERVDSLPDTDRGQRVDSLPDTDPGQRVH